MSDGKTDLKTDLDQLREDLKQLKADLGAEAQSQTSHLRDKVCGKSREYFDYGQDLVRERPVTSLLVAAGAGALMGMLLSRCRRD